MKTSASIPDAAFESAERLAADLQVPDPLTDAMNTVIDDVGSEVDEFNQQAARRALKKVEW
ncbi:MAG TPA: hypothetical protein VGG20_18885 [Thermoanaerobaculia bacterium]|jgi:hypothetical protein